MLERYYTSLVSLILEGNSLKVVKLGDDDYGLYAARLVNSFGTPLMARGTKAEMDQFLDKNNLPRENP